MQRHNLVNEFPQFKEKIHQLKLENNHFKKLFEEYDELEHQVYRINIDEEVVTDEYAHEVKSKLLHIKDEIFSMLKKQ
jgi:uncharacterized protein YdcH (DUF465 family)